ncbi:hypothetical protein Tco_1392267 [Tanacetum coccineum]
MDNSLGRALCGGFIEPGNANLLGPGLGLCFVTRFWDLASEWRCALIDFSGQGIQTSVGLVVDVGNLSSVYGGHEYCVDFEWHTWDPDLGCMLPGWLGACAGDFRRKVSGAWVFVAAHGLPAFIGESWTQSCGFDLHFLMWEIVKEAGLITVPGTGLIQLVYGLMIVLVKIRVITGDGDKGRNWLAVARMLFLFPYVEESSIRGWLGRRRIVMDAGCLIETGKLVLMSCRSARVTDRSWRLREMGVKVLLRDGGGVVEEGGLHYENNGGGLSIDVERK